MNTGLTHQIKDAAAKARDFDLPKHRFTVEEEKTLANNAFQQGVNSEFKQGIDIPPPIPKEPPQISGKQPKVTPLHISGHPIVVQPEINILNYSEAPSYFAIVMAMTGATCLGYAIHSMIVGLR